MAQRSKSRFRVALALGCAFAILGAIAPGSARVATDPCVHPQGGAAVRICDEDGLTHATLADGFELTTHGPDVFPIHTPGRFADVAEKKPSCVKNARREPHIQIVYAWFPDKTDRSGIEIPRLQKVARMMNGMLFAEAKEFNRKALMRFACSGGQASIRTFRMPWRSEQFNDSTNGFFATVLATRQAGFTNPMAKYWILADRPNFGDAAGVASYAGDDRPGADNTANYGPHYGVSLNQDDLPWLAEVMMHEGSHNLGAVPPFSPNSTGGAHCTDDQDVMCYPDGGPMASQYRTGVCSRTHYDCGHNDYFNPKPKKGSFLDDHWNLGWPTNHYFAFCQYKTGTLTAGQREADIDGNARGTVPDWSDLSRSKKVSIATGCTGRPFSLAGMYNAQPEQADLAVGQTPGTTLTGTPYHAHLARRGVLPDMDICFYDGSKKLKCFDGAGHEEGTVPSKADSARVFLGSGVNGNWILNIA